MQNLIKAFERKHQKLYMIVSLKSVFFCTSRGIKVCFNVLQKRFYIFPPEAIDAHTCCFNDHL